MNQFDDKNTLFCQGIYFYFGFNVSKIKSASVYPQTLKTLYGSKWWNRTLNLSNWFLKVGKHSSYHFKHLTFLFFITFYLFLKTFTTNWKIKSNIEKYFHRDIWYCSRSHTLSGFHLLNTFCVKRTLKNPISLLK